MRTLVAIVAAVLVAGNAFAQNSSTSTKAQIDALTRQIKQQADDIQLLKGQMARVVQYLQQRDAQSTRGGTPPPLAAANVTVTVDLRGLPTLGRPDAPVTMVEFSDFECPFCQRFFERTLTELKRDYIDSGKVRYVFVDFPLEDIHPKARKAAEAAQCAGDQGKFWEMHDALFKARGALAPEQLAQYARGLKLDLPAFETCLSSGSKSAHVNRGLSSGNNGGVKATPSFLIVRTAPGDTVSGTLNVVGAQPASVFRNAIDQLLAGAR